jgi:hypothetical protein
MHKSLKEPSGSFFHFKPLLTTSHNNPLLSYQAFYRMTDVLESASSQRLRCNNFTIYLYRRIFFSRTGIRITLMTSSYKYQSPSFFYLYCEQINARMCELFVNLIIGDEKNPILSTFLKKVCEKILKLLSHFKQSSIISL